MYTDDQIREIHKLAYRNEVLLKQSSLCGCGYCGRIFSPSLIGQDVGGWTDEYGTPLSLFDRGDGTRWDGWTYNRKTGERSGVCPYCAVDCLIPDAAGYPLTKEMLDHIYRLFFT